MSDPSVSAKSSIMGAHPFEGKSGGYSLSSDLARLSLPAEYRDEYRRLAWVNSICFLFLIVGLLGLKAPRVIVKPLSKPAEVIPVEFTPPEEQVRVQPEIKQEEPVPEDTPIETPQVATIVAAVDSPDIRFAVPVEGAVAITKEVRYAAPPPPLNQAPPAAVKFDPNAASSGSYPPPLYPGMAQRNKYQGTVTIDLSVDAQGNVTEAKVQKTSGFRILDEAALEVVKTRWKFPPGPVRRYIWPCTFELK